MADLLVSLYQHHDIRLVLLAAFICALAAFACISLLTHARRSEGVTRWGWLCIAAIAVGFGIWATHFVAMLSFDLGFPVGYDIGLTAASLLIAILVCGTGLVIAGVGNGRSDFLLGGAIVGIGISAMHYAGMLAFQVGGEIVWNPGLVAASMIAGMFLGALALALGCRTRNTRSRLVGTALLTLAVCSMHFTAMSAAGFENCYAVTGADAISPSVLSLFVGLVSLVILLAALGALYLDLRERKRASAEESRMRGLADAAVEGLMVCDGTTIVAVNASFRRLVGDDVEVTGSRMGDFLAPTGCSALLGAADELVETELGLGNGQGIPVEAVLRKVDFGGRPHNAVAIRDLRARKAAEHHIRFLAHHDAMTGLANRMSFNQRLQDEVTRSAAVRSRLAVLCLDLDRFKEVNDLYGHAAGDALLQKVAAVIEAELSDGQIAARLGGDEFAVIMPDLASREAADAMARRLIAAFARASADASDGTFVSASIGVALFPDDADKADHLMTQADTALYCAKAEGRGTHRLFEAQMGAQVRNRRQLEHDLRGALATGQLALVYQPQVDLTSHRVTGFEALVRWTHPDRGAVSPAIFIPIAEDSGLIMQLGEWVLRTACEEAASWTNPLHVAVNVSAVQLHTDGFVAFVQHVLDQTGLDPARLEIEITETAMIRNINRALASLRQLKAMGVKVAMDDFGTGYSSLSNLRAFPFDRIKVDQSFIRSVHNNEQSAAIVRAVLGLGKGLNLPILAEGVEVPEELDFLKSEVCQSAQGYWFGKPQAISAYADVVSGMRPVLEPLVETEIPEPLLRASA